MHGENKSVFNYKNNAIGGVKVIQKDEFIHNSKPFVVYHQPSKLAWSGKVLSNKSLYTSDDVMSRVWNKDIYQKINKSQNIITIFFGFVSKHDGT
jgi:hypothetical protein